MNLAVYTSSGTKSEPQSVHADVFGLEPNPELLNLAYRKYLANSRIAHASTLTRGQVSGGGKKPWRQKGTGRARVGSSRSPIWRHGGVIFGPTGSENFTLRMPLKMRRAAIAQALSGQARDGILVLVKDFKLSEGKTKQASTMLDKLDARGRVLVVLESANELLLRATANLANVTVISYRYLNVYDVLNADKILLEASAVEPIQNWLTTTTEAKANPAKGAANQAATPKATAKAKPVKETKA